MGYAIELYFDAQSEAAVRALWRALAAHHIDAVLPSLNARPHISLAAFADLHPCDLRDELAAFAAATPPLTTRFSAVGAFPTAEGVVYLAPVVTQELLAVHAALHARLAERGLTSHLYYRPGHWAPHCTVATDLPTEQIAAAIEVCRTGGVFRPVQLVGVDLVEFRPVKMIYEFPLQGEGR